MRCIEQIDAVEAAIRATIEELEGLPGVAYHNSEGRHYNRRKAIREMRLALHPLQDCRRQLAYIPDPEEVPAEEPPKAKAKKGAKDAK